MRGVRGEGDQDQSKTSRDPPETSPEGPVTGGSKRKKKKLANLKCTLYLCLSGILSGKNTVGLDYLSPESARESLQ